MKDHDTLIEMKTDIKYIKESIDDFKREIDAVKKRTSKLEQWRIDIMARIAVAGVVVFLLESIFIDWVRKKIGI